MFYQNHSTLYTVEIFSNSVLRKIILLGLEKSQTALLSSLGSDWLYDIMDLNLKKYLNHLTGHGLILWYIGLGIEKHLD